MKEIIKRTKETAASNSGPNAQRSNFVQTQAVEETVTKATNDPDNRSRSNSGGKVKV
jgi:hypothetical protein